MASKPDRIKRPGSGLPVFLFGLAWLLLPPLAAGIHAQEKPALPVVRLWVFASKDCGDCRAVQPEALKGLEEKLRCGIEARYFDIGDIASYALLTKFEEKYGDTDNDPSVLFIGREVIGGEKEVADRLEKAIVRYREAGGCPWPDGVSFPPPGEGRMSAAKPEETKPGRPAGVVSEKAGEKPAPIYLAFFHQYGCRECQRVFHLIRYVEKKHPAVVVREFDLSRKENQEINEAIGRRFNVPEERRLLTATLFIGAECLQGREITLERIEARIARYAATGSPCPWEIGAEDLAAGRRSALDRFRSFGPAAVAAAGAIDGINPCAFTTVVFLVSYLAFIGRRRREILLAGISFTLAVFLTYFLVGGGLFAFLRRLPARSLLPVLLTAAVGGLALGLGVLSFLDFLKARRGDFRGIALQLPEPVKGRIRLTISREMRRRGLLPAAFAAGFAVSVLELACTGQVYLPTITLIAGREEMRRAGLAYLLLYNAAFIMPLAAVFLAAYFGAASQRLADFARRRVAAVKLLTAVFFLVLGTLLLASLR